MDRNGEMTGNASAATDRRVRRTRHALQHALFELIVEKGYERISVSEIIEAADVGRSTFYLHYRDKEDLFLSSLDDEVRAALAGGAGEGSASLLLFRHADRHRDLYRALVRKRGGWSLAADRIQRTIADVFQERFLDAVADPKVPTPAAARFTSTALLGLLTWWLDTDMHMDADAVDEAFRQLANRGLDATIGVSL
jgi:AcrR family transcriptional regulator